MTVDRTTLGRDVSGSRWCDRRLNGQPLEIGMIIGTSKERLDLWMPRATKVEEQTCHRARLTLEPLARGFGSTLGAALQRVLLTSLPGCAPTQVTLAQAAHEQATLDGVGEGVLKMMLNLKGVVFRMQGREEVSLALRADRAGTVRAGDILTPTGVQVLNPAHVISQLSPGARLDMQIKVEVGRGHLAGQLQRHPAACAVGAAVIRLDACFSPVRRVDYAVEPTRLAQCTDLDRLVLDIETDGAITPEDALGQAARLLMDQLDRFSPAPLSCLVESAAQARGARARTHGQVVLMRPVDELDFTVRTGNCLRAENIVLVGELVQRTETDLMRAPNLGRRSLNEIKDALAALGLTLGTTVPGWPPTGGGRAH